jgi:drug/metabolite transporter (DMT)-like permease
MSLLSATTLIIGLFAGAIGLGYLAYGKKTSKLWFIISGIILIVYPYFVSNDIAQIVTGILLIVCPVLL